MELRENVQMARSCIYHENNWCSRDGYPPFDCPSCTVFKAKEGSLMNAKVWLLNKIKSDFTWTDFQIIECSEVADGKTIKAPVRQANNRYYTFKVHFFWQLNAWTKEVTKEIKVVWVDKEKDFISTF